MASTHVIRNTALSFLAGAYGETVFHAFVLGKYEPYSHGGSPFLIPYLDILIVAPIIPFVVVVDLVRSMCGDASFRFELLWNFLVFIVVSTMTYVALSRQPRSKNNRELKVPGSQ